MENNEQLEKILSGLQEKWNNWKKSSGDELESILKESILLKVGKYSSTIEEYETNTLNKSSKAYRKLSECDKNELHELYSKKVLEINQFLNSFCATICKQHRWDTKIIERICGDLSDTTHGAILEEYFKYDVLSWIHTLYSYYLSNKETPITYGALSNKVREDIADEVYINKWVLYVQNEDFQGLAKWVKEFVDNANESIINETKNDIERLKNRVNPQFFLLKTSGENTAIVFDDEGNLHVFLKGKGSIPYSKEYARDFKNLIKINEQAFPVFNPETW